VVEYLTVFSHVGFFLVLLNLSGVMNEVTRILCGIEQGNHRRADELLPLVYQELRHLAARKLMHEEPAQTLDATALVHEAYVRLIDVRNAQRWNSRGHFFAAAAEAMRRILIESARRKKRQKRGGTRRRIDLDDVQLTIPGPCDDVIALDEAITKLAEQYPARAELVKLRYFAGLTIDEACSVLGISTATAERYWTFARAWLYRQIERDGQSRGA